MFCESLESRRLMTVVASAGGNQLYVYGDDNANDIRVRRGDGADVGDIVVSYKTPAGYYQKVYQVSDAKIDKVLVTGRAGNDHIEVGYEVLADVTLYGGHGADYLKSGGLNSQTYGDYPAGLTDVPDDNAADTLVRGSQKTSKMWGQGGNDKFYTDLVNPNFNDWGSDFYYGGSGNDSFNTAVGSFARESYVFGQDGNDTLFARSDRVVNFYAGPGSDTLDFSAATESIYLHVTSTSTYCGSRVTDSSRKTHVDATLENGVGSKYNDDIYINGDTAGTVKGGDGNDFIYGRAGKDVIYGGNGNDTIFGFGGNDSLYGEAGNDSLNGGGGNDLLSGGSGSDYFWDKDGNMDTISGGTETDHITAKDVMDLVYGVP